MLGAVVAVGQMQKVEPAVVVADETGNVTQWRSWKSLKNWSDDSIKDVEKIKLGTMSKQYDPGLLQ